MAIDVHEVTPQRPDLLEALVIVRNDTITDVNPDDPPSSAAELGQEIFSTTVQRHVRSWVAFLDGAPAGEATFELEDDEENEHIAASDWFAVRAPMRRRGVADSLLARALDELASDGRTTLQLWAPALDPDVGRAYAERLGLDAATVERCSRLRVADVDEDLLDRWCVDDARRVGYRLLELGDRCPDELMTPYLQAVAAMDDMPTDDLAWTVAPTDEVLARSREEHWRATRRIVARSLVLGPRGDGAGFSELFVSEHRPTLAWQGDTGVVPVHRGRGLGRWLKAANLRHARRLAPAVEIVETYNAESNPWMLDINVAMGFRPHVTYRCFQGDLQAARSRLDAISV